jgi:integrase
LILKPFEIIESSDGHAADFQTVAENRHDELIGKKISNREFLGSEKGPGVTTVEVPHGLLAKSLLIRMRPRILKKFYRLSGLPCWKILEREVVDEVIFRTLKPRNRLLLELMARGGMRISGVLQLTPIDIEDRRLTPRSPKSGKGREIVFIPQKVADRLRKTQGPEQIHRLFKRGEITESAYLVFVGLRHPARKAFRGGTGTRSKKEPEEARKEGATPGNISL